MNNLSASQQQLKSIEIIVSAETSSWEKTEQDLKALRVDLNLSAFSMVCLALLKEAMRQDSVKGFASILETYSSDIGTYSHTHTCISTSGLIVEILYYFSPKNHANYLEKTKKYLEILFKKSCFSLMTMRIKKRLLKNKLVKLTDVALIEYLTESFSLEYKQSDISVLCSTDGKLDIKVLDFVIDKIIDEGSCDFDARMLSESISLLIKKLIATEDDFDLLFAVERLEVWRPLFSVMIFNASYHQKISFYQAMSSNRREQYLQWYEDKMDKYYLENRVSKESALLRYLEYKGITPLEALESINDVYHEQCMRLFEKAI